MCVLMLFNDIDRLSYREILDMTNIPDADLKRSLQSLACAKVTHRSNTVRSSSMVLSNATDVKMVPRL